MSEGPQRHTRFSDYLDLLKAFDDRGVEVLIVGGHAVNFWAEAFEKEEPELSQWRPFTSADLDLCKADDSAHQLLRSQAKEVEDERDPFGKAFTIVTHTFLIEDVNGNVLPVDTLKMVAGLRQEEVKRGSVTVESAGVTFRVLNPIVCLKAKLYNLRTLDQRLRQDQKHVRVLIPCVRAFVRLLLLEAKAGGNYRLALNALKLLLLYTSRVEMIRTARAFGLNLLETLPRAEIAASNHPKILNFAAHQLAKWHRKLQSIV